MTPSPARLILTCEGFSPRDELHSLAQDKAAKILRHDHPRVHLLRVHVKRETRHSAPDNFAVRATAEHAGRDHVIHADAGEPDEALHAALAKLERALSNAAGVRRHERHAGDPALA